MARDKEELTKHTLNIYAGDYAKIASWWPEIGAAAVIRRIIRQFVEKVEADGEGEKTDIPVTF